MAQTFETTDGERLTVVVSHLKSKGSACAGDPDTGDGAGNCNVTRTNAAKALVDWLAGDPTGSGDPDFLMIGDLNSYTFEDPITWIDDHGYANLVAQYGGLDAYSYVFDGESGYLDHGLASDSLAAQATGATDWHINPDEPTVLDYNVEFKTSNQVNTFYAPHQFRSSDHDPVVIGFDMGGPNVDPVVTLVGQNAADEGDTVHYTYSTTDADSSAFATDSTTCGTGGTLSNETGSGGFGGFDCTFPDGPTSSTVEVCVSDDEDGSDCDSIIVAVSNVEPVVALLGPLTADEGTTKHYTFTESDVAADTITFVSATCGAGNTLSGLDNGDGDRAGSFDCTFPLGGASSDRRGLRHRRGRRRRRVTPCRSRCALRRQKKADVRETLNSMLPTGNKDTDKRIKDAVADLDKSLAAANWIDGSHLVGEEGRVRLQRREARDRGLAADQVPERRRAGKRSTTSVRSTASWHRRRSTR